MDSCSIPKDCLSSISDEREIVNRLISAKDLLNNDCPLSLAMSSNGDESFDGSCPCATIYGDGFMVEMHCWRTSCKHGCEYSGIHVSGTISKRMKQKIAKHIRDNNGWTNSTEWNIVIL